MNISLIRFIIAAVLIMIGILIMVIQTFGVFRLNYALNRMHAAAMGDSLGIMMIVLGMMVIYGISFASLKLLTVLVVFWFASPVCSHLLAKLEVSTNEQIEDECEVFSLFRQGRRLFYFLIACAADHLYCRSEFFKKSAGFCCYLYGI